MSDDDLIRRGDALAAVRKAHAGEWEVYGWGKIHERIAALPAVTPAPDAAAIREAALREALEAMRNAGSFGRTAVEKHAALEQYCLDRDAILALLTEKPHDR